MKVNNWEWGDILFLGVTIVVATALLAVALWLTPTSLYTQTQGTPEVCRNYWEPWRCEIF